MTVEFVCVIGMSTVEFECVEKTNVILIHSNKLNYTQLGNEKIATVTSLPDGKSLSVTSTWLHIPTQYLVVELDSQLVKGSKYALYTEFTGELADDLGGFYRSEYDDGEGKK